MCLFTQAEFCNRGTITLDVLFLQVGQQVAATADHFQQAAAAVVIVFVVLQVLVQVVDARGQQRDLNLGRTSVVLMNAGGLDDGLFVLHFNNSSFSK